MKRTDNKACRYAVFFALWITRPW